MLSDRGPRFASPNVHGRFPPEYIWRLSAEVLLVLKTHVVQQVRERFQ